MNLWRIPAAQSRFLVNTAGISSIDGLLTRTSRELKLVHTRAWSSSHPQLVQSRADCNMSTPSWQEITQIAQARRATSIAAVQPSIPTIPKDLPLSVIHLPAALLTAREVEITELKPERLIAALASGSITAREVTGAFLRRAGLAQGLVCPFSPPF